MHGGQTKLHLVPAGVAASDVKERVYAPVESNSIPQYNADVVLVMRCCRTIVLWVASLELATSDTALMRQCI
jgi:hypothetical protein